MGVAVDEIGISEGDLAAPKPDWLDRVVRPALARWMSSAVPVGGSCRRVQTQGNIFTLRTRRLVVPSFDYRTETGLEA